MKIKSPREADKLSGLKVRYMRPNSLRYGWNGIINWANTKVAEVIWTTPEGDKVFQKYRLYRFYHEHETGYECGRTACVMIVDQKFADEVKQLETGVATPEEDEEFERINKSPYSELAKGYEGVAYESQRPDETRPDWPLREIGRNIERFGKLLQDPKSTMSDLAGAAHDAGLKLRLGIQPKMEETTNEGLQA